MPHENVTQFPLTKQQAESRLREIAEDSRRVVNTVLQGGPEHAWGERVAFRQALLCLKEGRVVGKPRVDENGNHVCMVCRMCAGLDVRVTFALEPADDGKVFILKVENEL